MDELKPCPFCGGKARVKDYGNGETFRVVCENYLCPAESFIYHTAQEAIDWWNRRANDDRL